MRGVGGDPVAIVAIEFVSVTILFRCGIVERGEFDGNGVGVGFDDQEILPCRRVENDRHGTCFAPTRRSVATIGGMKSHGWNRSGRTTVRPPLPPKRSSPLSCDRTRGIGFEFHGDAVGASERFGGHVARIDTQQSSIRGRPDRIVGGLKKTLHAGRLPFFSGKNSAETRMRGLAQIVDQIDTAAGRADPQTALAIQQQRGDARRRQRLCIRCLGLEMRTVLVARSMRFNPLSPPSQRMVDDSASIALCTCFVVASSGISDGGASAPAASGKDQKPSLPAMKSVESTIDDRVVGGQRRSRSKRALDNAVASRNPRGTGRVVRSSRSASSEPCVMSTIPRSPSRAAGILEMRECRGSMMSTLLLSTPAHTFPSRRRQQPHGPATAQAGRHCCFAENA